MGRHRAPDPDEPTSEPSEDYSEPHDVGDIGDSHEPDTGDIPAESYGDHPTGDYPDQFADDSGYFDYTDPSERDEHGEEDLHPADVDTADDFPGFAGLGQEPPDAPPTGGHRGLADWRGGHRSNGGRRGVSIGVIAALVAVVVVVAGVILWRFFGDALSNRSHSAARCTGDKQNVAVIADPSIADHVQQFAERYNGSGAQVGDHCVAVSVKSTGSDAVVGGFIGNWPADLGQRPALWIPGSSVSAARLTAAAGKETIAESRSLVTSPVVLAVRPELQRALGDQKWSTLPGLQTKPDGLAA
ncbi:MAG: hypothetical protein WB785_07790, partial [Mycobacterium sp.]